MYNLSERRVVSTKREGGELYVVIKDDVKSIELPSKRWSTFVRQLDNIEEAVKQLREQQYVKYFHHIGDNWYVSVTTGFYCVDFRRFYESKEGEIKPTRDGIALKLQEWESMRVNVSQLEMDMAILDAVYYAGDPHHDYKNSHNSVM